VRPVAPSPEFDEFGNWSVSVDEAKFNHSSLPYDCCYQIFSGDLGEMNISYNDGMKEATLDGWLLFTQK
jgi:hypothetical protein